MPAILPSIKIDSTSLLAEYFMPHQLAWILAEDPFHERKQQVFALAEKSVRIGWTMADAFKNVRKRLRFKNRDYLFATKDYPSALEYIRLARDFTELYSFTKAIVSHGEAYLKVNRLNPDGRSSVLTEEITISYIKFDNGSRIMAFSAHPQAMAVYGGDVGLDEFAKHPNAELLWQTAQGRVTWAFDLALWSSHEGDDTLFNQFAQQARATCSGASVPACDSAIEIQNSKIKNANTASSPWNLYFKVTITDAIELGLVDMINLTRDSAFTPEKFLADCRARSGLEQIFQQSYMCNPLPGGASIVDWCAIERCRSDYEIDRVHFEEEDIITQFGSFDPANQQRRQSEIEIFIRDSFPSLFDPDLSPIKDQNSKFKNPALRLGFDIAASGQGDLAVIYIDEAKADALWLRALFSCRTEDWDFLKTVLFYFLDNLRNLQAAGDETGLGRQICWEAAKHYSSRFLKVNFSARKHDLGFALMNQLAVTEKRFPKSEQDIASDYFALRKAHNGSKWAFSEGRNLHNPASHCDIAWAGALATHAHTERKNEVGAAILLENGMVRFSDGTMKVLPHPDYPT